MAQHSDSHSSKEVVVLNSDRNEMNKEMLRGNFKPWSIIHLSTGSVDLGGWLRWLGPVFKSRNPFTVFHPHIHTHTPQIYTIITRQHKMWLKKVSRHFPLCSSHHERKNDKVIAGRVSPLQGINNRLEALSQTSAADLRLSLRYLSNIPVTQCLSLS